MARILLATWPFRGHLLPHLEIARALIAHRHVVALYCGEGAAPVLEGEAISLFTFQRLGLSCYDRRLFHRQRHLSWAGPFQALKMCEEWLLNSMRGQVADLEEILRNWRPDVIVCDETMWGGTLVLAEKHKIPMAVCSTVGGCMLPGPESPQMGLGIGPLRGPGSALLRKLIEGGTAIASYSVRRRASECRREHGLPPLRGSIRAMAGKAPVYLARGAPEFDYRRRDLPPTVHYVGPLEARGTALDQVPDWLEELSGETPVVYVSEGTLRLGESLILRSALQGLAGLDMRVVMTAGGYVDDDQAFDKLPPNFRFERWVSEWRLFPHVKVVVTAGGAGTVMGALAAGVPMLVIPQEIDQPDNARRVIECGAGLALPRRKCSPQTLRDSVLRLIRESSFRAGAVRMKQIFAKYDSRQQAVAAIEALVKGEAR